MTQQPPRIPYTPTPLEGLHVFRTMRALLKQLGLKCPIAETYAKDAVVRYRKLMQSGQYELAATMLTQERAEFYRRVHNAAEPMNLCDTCGRECDYPHRPDAANNCTSCVAHFVVEEAFAKAGE